jgi:Protein of unknown function (DUF2637)
VAGRTPTWWTARLSLAAVTGIAGVASYLHAYVVVQAADGQTFVARCIPVLADLVIASAAANLLDASRDGGRLPRLSVVAGIVGVVVTVAANVASGDPHSVPAWCVNVWPPVAFVLALESLVGHVRRGRDHSHYEEYVTSGGEASQGPLDVPEVMRSLVAHYGSQRKASAELKIQRDHLRKLITPPAELAAAGLNGDGHE